MRTLEEKNRGMFWERNEKKIFAEKAGIGANNLSDILHRRRKVSPDTAIFFAHLAKKHLGKSIPWECWVCSHRTRHAAFYGEPKIKFPKGT